MDKLFTGNYEDNDNQTEKDEISELLNLLNGMNAEDEQFVDEKDFSENLADESIDDSVDEFENSPEDIFHLEEEEEILIGEDLQYSNILEEFEVLEKKEEQKKSKKKKENIKILDKIKDIFFQKIDVEQEEIDENERILKELEKVSQKKEKKTKVLKEKAEKKEARKESRKKRNEARLQTLEKLKKAKKAELPKEPEEKVRVTPVFMGFMLTLVAGIVIIIIVGTNAYSYNFSFNSAKDNFFNQKYELAYEKVAGLTPRGEDETFYRQIMTVMYVEKQYLSFENYMDLGMEQEALNSLIKGVNRYDKYKTEAESLGVSTDMEVVYSNISNALVEDFGLSDEEARELNLLTDLSEYTKQLNSYLGYN